MYEHFFNLKAEPFRLSPDHRFCYSHTQYAKAKAYMAYAFMRAEGFVMVTGEPGTGKTTLIGDLVESLADENVAVAKLVSTQLAADDLLRMVAFAFDLPADIVEKSSILQHLSARFLGLHREGGRALLIVDEAQDLTAMAMEELRLLTNLQQDGQPLLQIFLLGQPELRELIHAQGLEQVHQRIIATSHLQALKEDETRAYVEHRLRVVGWCNDPAISTAVFPIIYQFSEGVPRRINLICSRLFLHTFVEQRHQIGVQDARTVVQELQDEQLSTRNLLNDDLFFAQDVFEFPLPAEDLQPVTSLKPESSNPNHTVASDSESSLDKPLQTSDASEPMLEVDIAVELEDIPEVESLEVVRLLEDEGAPANPPPSVRQSAKVHTEKSLVSMEAWIILFAALIAAGFVVFLIGIDDIL